MKFKDLPEWAKNEVLNSKMLNKHFEGDKEALQEYLDGKDDFEIEYDEDGENPVVNF